MPSNVKDDAGKPLEYEQRAALVSQRQYRRLMALTLLNTILLAGFIVGPSVGPMVKAQWQAFQERREKTRLEVARQARFEAGKRYVAPADQVVYEERPDEAAKLLAQFPTQYHILREARPVYFPPHPWQQPVARVSDSPVDAGNASTITLFLHGRTGPSGQERLVCVRLTGGQSMNELFSSEPPIKQRTFSITTRRMLTAQTIDVRGEQRALALGRERPEGLAVWKPGPDNWENGQVEFQTGGLYRFYAGQPDPNNASHFTIDYELDGKRATIDGWLRANDVVELVPREGVIVDRDARGIEIVWEPRLTKGK